MIIKKIFIDNNLNKHYEQKYNVFFSLHLRNFIKCENVRMQETKFYDYNIGRKMSKQLGFIDGTESSGGGSSGEDRDRGCWVVRLVRAEQ